MKSEKSIVVIAPHVDDELIGCYSLFKERRVSHVVYVFEHLGEENAHRRLEAEMFCHHQGVTPIFVRGTEGLNIALLNEEVTFSPSTHILAAPNIKDNHPHHRILNAWVKATDFERLYYSVDMNIGSGVKVLSPEDQTAKLELLIGAYPSQRSLFESNAAYHLFEGIVEDDLETSITVRTQFEGIHYYEKAPDEVSFLRHPHRHIFHVEITASVTHDDREIEFIMLKRDLELHIQMMGQKLHYKSCEMLCKDFLKYMLRGYGARKYKISVFEDGENGATVNYDF